VEVGEPIEEPCGKAAPGELPPLHFVSPIKTLTTAATLPKIVQKSICPERSIHPPGEKALVRG